MFPPVKKYPVIEDRYLSKIKQVREAWEMGRQDLMQALEHEALTK